MGDRPGHPAKEFVRRLDHTPGGVPSQVAGLEYPQRVGQQWPVGAPLVTARGDRRRPRLGRPCAWHPRDQGSGPLPFAALPSAHGLLRHADSPPGQPRDWDSTAPVGRERDSRSHHPCRPHSHARAPAAHRHASVLLAEGLFAAGAIVRGPPRPPKDALADAAGHGRPALDRRAVGRPAIAPGLAPTSHVVSSDDLRASVLPSSRQAVAVWFHRIRPAGGSAGRLRAIGRPSRRMEQQPWECEQC